MCRRSRRAAGLAMIMGINASMNNEHEPIASIIIAPCPRPPPRQQQEQQKLEEQRKGRRPARAALPRRGTGRRSGASFGARPRPGFTRAHPIPRGGRNKDWIPRKGGCREKLGQSPGEALGAPGGGNENWPPPKEAVDKKLAALRPETPGRPDSPGLLTVPRAVRPRAAVRLRGVAARAAGAHGAQRRLGARGPRPRRRRSADRRAPKGACSRSRGIGQIRRSRVESGRGGKTPVPRQGSPGSGQAKSRPDLGLLEESGELG
eukprot:gene10951-biopygen10258